MSKVLEEATTSMIYRLLGNLYKIKELEQIIRKVVLLGEMVQL
jgi:hypothetical protein